MRQQSRVVAGLVVAVLAFAGCTVPASPSVGQRVSGSPSPSAPTPEGVPPMQGPTDLPPTPTSLPPALEQVDTTVSTNQTGQVTSTGTTEYVLDMVNNADRVWSTWFKSEGYPAPHVFLQLIQPGSSYTNEDCWMAGQDGVRIITYPADFLNAFYCDDDNGVDKGIIVIPITSFARLWTGDIYGTKVTDPKAIGDFAAGVVLSHEFGHHITAELAMRRGIAPMAKGKNKELLADCFAGVHAQALSLGIDGHLDPGDTDEALAALTALGDKGETKDPHGTPEERRSAFTLGLNGNAVDPRGGVPNTCLREYWPAAARPAA